MDSGLCETYHVLAAGLWLTLWVALCSAPPGLPQGEVKNCGKYCTPVANWLICVRHELAYSQGYASNLRQWSAYSPIPEWYMHLLTHDLNS